MAERMMRYVERLIGQVELGLHQQLLLDSGRIFMMLGALVLMHQQMATSAAASSHAEEHVLVAFLLWLLGMSLAMLSLVARQFPRLAFAAAAVARALRNYLLGGL